MKPCIFNDCQYEGTKGCRVAGLGVSGITECLKYKPIPVCVFENCCNRDTYRCRARGPEVRTECASYEINCKACGGHGRIKGVKK